MIGSHTKMLWCNCIVALRLLTKHFKHVQLKATVVIREAV